MNQIYQLKTIYTTQNKSRSYPIELSAFHLPTDKLPINTHKTTALCKAGCKNYERNGGCPPFAPSCNEIIEKFRDSIIVYIKLLTEDYPPTSLSSNHYIRWNFTESFMPRLLRNIIKPITELLAGISLSSGHCSSCRPCNLKLGNKICLNPCNRTFSMEATGIDVSSLMATYSNSPIQWWKKDDPLYIPEYQMRVGIIFYNLDKQPPNINSLFTFIKNIDGISLIQEN